MTTPHTINEPRSEPKYNDYLGIPVHYALKAEIRALAKAEERDMTSMARVLLREAIDARISAAPAGVRASAPDAASLQQRGEPPVPAAPHAISKTR